MSLRPRFSYREFKQSFPDFWIYVWLIVIVLAISGAWTFTYFELKDLGEEERGTFGDMFGSVNALFSGFALAGIVFTIFLQKRELRLQRKELKSTRAEFALQNQTMKKQQFENLFFNMISLHNQIVEELHIGSIRSRKVFERLFEQLYSEMWVSENRKSQFEMNDFNKVYKNFYAINNSLLGHYYRNLYRIFKIIDGTDFYQLDEVIDGEKVTEQNIDTYNDTQRLKYGAVMRAQLSDLEGALLFYNGVYPLGKKFLPLIKKYNLLKHMPHERMVWFDELKEPYGDLWD